MTTGQKIRELRRERKWTQAELGEQAGINFSNINRYEQDKLKPGATILSRLSKAFGIPIEELTGSPTDPAMALQDEELLACFQQVQVLGEEDRAAIKRLIQAMVIKNQVQSIGRMAG